MNAKKNFESMSDKKLLKSAKNGDAEAQNIAACHYFFKGDYTKAVKLWKPSAKQGNLPAIYNLGTAYASGKGVRQDRVKAVSYFLEVVKKGDSEAISDIFRICGETVGNESLVQKSSEEVLKIASVLGIGPKHPTRASAHAPQMAPAA